MAVENDPSPPAKKRKTTYTMIDIVDKPSGDLIIRVGTRDTGLIRVHRSVLAMVSPVFRAMLTGGFSEANRTLDDEDHLVLDDDDYASFIDFCKAVHHQTISPSPTLDRVAAVAVITD